MQKFRKILVSVMMIVIILIALVIGWVRVSDDQPECFQFEPQQKCKTLEQIIKEKETVFFKNWSALYKRYEKENQSN